MLIVMHPKVFTCQIVEELKVSASTSSNTMPKQGKYDYAHEWVCSGKYHLSLHDYVLNMDTSFMYYSYFCPSRKSHGLYYMFQFNLAIW
jgi:hypothetical protein